MNELKPQLISFSSLLAGPKPTSTAYRLAQLSPAQLLAHLRSLSPTSGPEVTVSSSSPGENAGRNEARRPPFSLVPWLRLCAATALTPLATACSLQLAFAASLPRSPRRNALEAEARAPVPASQTWTLCRERAHQGQLERTPSQP
uniref:Uncharacterized protein n=1 Tax=Arundo donax TaxID=35708 RepID=A0A0A9D7R9_ARUDO